MEIINCDKSHKNITVANGDTLPFESSSNEEDLVVSLDKQLDSVPEGGSYHIEGMLGGG